MAAFIVTTKRDGDYLVVETNGKLLTLKDLIEHAQASFGRIRSNKAKKTILDIRETYLPKDMLSYYKLVDYYEQNVDPRKTIFFMAVLVSKESYRQALIWETVALEKGFNVKVFEKYNEAKNWLATCDQ